MNKVLDFRNNKMYEDHKDSSEKIQACIGESYGL